MKTVPPGFMWLTGNRLEYVDSGNPKQGVEIPSNATLFLDPKKYELGIFQSMALNARAGEVIGERVIAVTPDGKHKEIPWEQFLITHTAFVLWRQTGGFCPLSPSDEDLPLYLWATANIQRKDEETCYHASEFYKFTGTPQDLSLEAFTVITHEKASGFDKREFLDLRIEGIGIPHPTWLRSALPRGCPPDLPNIVATLGWWDPHGTQKARRNK